MTLKEIAQQLEMCNIECQGGNIKMNVAFIALKEMAEKEE
jgi:hypothetical protein